MNISGFEFGDNFTDLVSTSLEGLLNSTNGSITTRAPRSAGKPPPPGYYGDMRETLWKVVPPIIISWGTIGNILTILVLLRQTKWSSTAIYLLALSLSDMVILYSGPLRNWIRFMWEVDIRLLSDSGCKAQLYLTYCSIHFSSWVLVAVTWERVISVVVPHKVRLFCTPKKTGIILFVMLILIFSVNMVLPIITSLDGIKLLTCSPRTEEFTDFRDDVFTWIDFCVAFAVPFLLLLIGNILIIVQLKRSHETQRKMSYAYGGRDKKDGNAKELRSVSILVILLCVVFLLTMTPVTVFLIYYPYAFEDITELFKTDPVTAWYDYQYLLFVHAVLNLVGYCNASFNFILYVFSGSKFRSELKALFCCSGRNVMGIFGTVSRSSSKTTTTSFTNKKPNAYVVAVGEDEKVGRFCEEVDETETFSTKPEATE